MKGPTGFLAFMIAGTLMTVPAFGWFVLVPLAGVIIVAVLLGLLGEKSQQKEY